LGGFAVDLDRSTLGAVEPSKQIHQGALASTVLAQKSVNLTPAELQVYVIYGEHARKLLDHALHLDRIFASDGLAHVGFSKTMHET
jgi:hypothetical protein